jgi:hypothetical protein
MRTIVPEQEIPEVRGMNPELAGKFAECDGGGHFPGTRYAGRQDFTGMLTGEFVELGDPVWRWYLMTNLTVKPEQFEGDAVWCLGGNVFLVEDDSVVL